MQTVETGSSEVKIYLTNCAGGSCGREFGSWLAGRQGGRQGRLSEAGVEEPR